MSRPLRIQYPGAYYHVCARGNERRQIFWSDKDRVEFCDLLGKISQHFSISLLAFTLMSNHFHLLLQTPFPNLARAMHWLKTTYSVRVNLRRRRSGHLFQGRYHSVHIEGDEQLLEGSRYVHLNSLRAGIVKRPEDYQWSSFMDYIRPRARWPWLHRDLIWGMLGGGKKGKFSNYRKFVLDGIDLEDNFWDGFRSGVVWGGDEFKEKLRELLKDKRNMSEVLHADDLIEAPDIDKMQKSIAQALSDLEFKIRDRKAAMIYILRELGFGLKEIGSRFGVCYAGVSLAHKRYSVKLQENKSMAETIGKILLNVKR